MSDEKLSRPTIDLYEHFKPSVNNVIYASPSSGSAYVTLDSITTDSTQNFNLDTPNEGDLSRAGSSGTRSGTIMSNEISRVGPVHPPKIRQHSPHPRPTRNKEQSQFTPQGRLCPFCKAPTNTECGCQMCVSTCANGHRFYYDPVSKQPIPLNFTYPQQYAQQYAQQPPTENGGEKRARTRETRVTPVVQG